MGDQLEKLRAKLEEFTEAIEASDEKVLNHKNNTQDGISRINKLDVDLQQSKRRIILIQKDLEVTQERLGNQEQQLAKTQGECEEIEKVRDELESSEQEKEEAIENLGTSINDMKRKVAINASRLVESERREGVCHAEIAKLREKAEKDEARVKELEGTIEGFGVSLAELEEREGEAGDRESMSEEKIGFLERKLKEVSGNAEAGERMSHVLQNGIFELMEQIQEVTTKRDEMMASVGMMDDVADDPRYNIFDIVAGYAGRDDEGRNTPASIFGAKSDLSFKGQGGGGSRSGSRAGAASGRETPADEAEADFAPAASPSPEPEPSPESPEPAPAPAPEPAKEESEEEESEEEESEEEDDDW